MGHHIIDVWDRAVSGDMLGFFMLLVAFAVALGAIAVAAGRLRHRGT